MKLVYDGTDELVQVGDRIEKDGEVWLVESIQKPHKPSSTGRVYVSLPDPNEPKNAGTRGFFPSVIGAHWIDREDHECEDTDNPFDVTGHEHAMSKRPW